MLNEFHFGCILEIKAYWIFPFKKEPLQTRLINRTFISDDKFYYLIQEVIEFVNINTITEHDAIEVVNIEDLPYRFFRQLLPTRWISNHKNEYCKFDLPSKQKTLNWRDKY